MHMLMMTKKLLSGESQVGSAPGTDTIMYQKDSFTLIPVMISKRTIVVTFVPMLIGRFHTRGRTNRLAFVRLM